MSGRRMMKYHGGKRGSMITETVIFLPIFIISILTLSSLIKAIYLQVFVFEALADEARKASVESYIFGKGEDLLPDRIKELFIDAGNRQIFLYSIRSGLEERGIEAQNIRLNTYDFEKGFFGISDLTKVNVSYHMKINLPAAFIREISIENSLYFRSWNGESHSGAVFPFEQMLADEDGNIVYLFPNAGEKYHNKSCRYISSYAFEVTADGDLFKKYDACPLCIKGDVKYGETVYIFQYGNSYHRADCHSVKKYVIEMDREDALTKNFTACSVCGG